MSTVIASSLFRASRLCSWTLKRSANNPLLQLRLLHTSVEVYTYKKARGSIDPDERLKNLRSGEKTVAIFAGISLLIGFIALKSTFFGMSSRSASIQASLKSQQELPVIVVAGPSGSGKSTLLTRLFQEYPDKFAFSVSHTTRKPRSNETHGKDYYFTTHEKMQKEIASGEFIEWAEYSGNLYGTSVKSVKACQKQGKVCVLDIDMQGVRSIKKTDLNAIFIHIKPPSLQILEQRLRDRKSDSEDAIKKRLEVAKSELQYAAIPGTFDQIIVNDEAEKAYRDLDEVIKKMILT